MKHSHMVMCALLMVGGVALLAAGAGALALLPAVACMAMMGAMVWMMLGGRGDRSGGDRT